MSEIPTDEDLEQKSEKLEIVMAERKRAEEKLTKEESYYHLLFETANDAIFILEDYRFTECNKMTLKMFGCEKKDIMGSYPWEYSPPNQPDGRASKEKAIEVLEASLKGKPQKFYWKHSQKNGREFDAEVSLNCLGAEKKLVQAIVRDITDRRRAEHALQESEDKFRTLVELSPLGISLIAKDGRYKYTNPQFRNIFGYTLEDIPTGKDWFKRAFPDKSYRKEVVNTWLEDLKQTGVGQSRPRTYSVNCKNGSSKQVKFIPVTLKNFDQFIVYEDITERKKAENELRKSENKMKSIFKAAPIGIGVVINRVFQDVNKRFCEITGYSKNELIGKSARIVYPTDEDYEYVGSAKYNLIEKSGTGAVETRFRCKDGKIINVLLSSTPLDPKDLSLGVTFTALDFTEQKRIEKELRQNQERYQLATKGGNVGIWDWNLLTDDMFVSPNLKAMLGYDDHEIKNHIEDWGKNVYPEDTEAVMKETNACIEGANAEYRVEHRMVHKDGSLRWFLASGKVERDEDGQAIRFVGTDTDITQLKALEDKLRQSHKMEALGTLSGGIAHEFNNILGIIIGNTELAIDDVPEWNPAKDCLEEIRAASLRAKDVVRQIMSFSRKTPASRKPIKVSTIIQESLKMMRATIPTNIEIRQEILCNDEMILANPTEISQIFMNLCGNSVHAMEEETSWLKVRLETTVLDHRRAAQYNGLTSGEFVKLTVKDNGSGIDPKIRSLIFDPYFTTKDVDKGLGMGLAVVYGIVKKHDGDIRVNSKVGKGTTVEVLFPITKETAQIEKEVSKYLPRGTERILFVDDEASLVKLVTQMLERQGYEVVGKTSSTEALKLFQEESDKFDLVITDMAMPVMSGDRLVKELIRIRPSIPVIICTGYSDRMGEEKAMESGIAAYTMKPLVKTDLVKTVRRVLDKSKGST